ncbi:hypothetical protein C8J56DRAFT_786091, partial [Mycena floridula]
LSAQLPEIHDATFVDLHPSLGNLDHLGTYIKQAQAYCYPEGLGWKGKLMVLAIAVRHQSMSEKS